ncbi:MAG: LytR C-terminal domain-containing protein [Actinomycetota bacterium]
MANPSRFLLIVALVVGGILVLANAFEAPTVAANPEPAASPTKEKPNKQNGGQQTGDQQNAGDPDAGTTGDEPVTDITGLRIAVFNATDATGLAGTVDVILTRPKNGAQQAMEPGDSAEALETTGLYYEEDPDGANQAAAEYIAQEVLEVRDATIAPLGDAPGILINGEPSKISADVQVAVFVGSDYTS